MPSAARVRSVGVGAEEENIRGGGIAGVGVVVLRLGELTSNIDLRLGVARV